MQVMIKLEDRILDAETRFNDLSRQRDSINEEMTKIQGEHRILVELRDSEPVKKPNNKATVIEAVPEEDK